MPDSCKAHEGDEESDQCAGVCVTVENVGIEEEEEGVMSKVREKEKKRTWTLLCRNVFQ